MNVNDIKSEIDGLDEFDKLKIYINYYTIQLVLKHVHSRMPNYYSFDEFINPKNKGYYNNSNDWQQDLGIYDWYWKFYSKCQIKKN